MSYDKHGSAYWVSGTDVIDIETSHVQAIIDDPELFGLSSEHVKSRYAAHSERLGLEGKARCELIIDACRNGWVRVRHYNKGPGDYWSVQIDTVTRIGETVRAFIETMINDGTVSPNDELQIVAVDDNVVLPYTFADGGAQRFLYESEIAIPRNRYRVYHVGDETDRMIERVFQADMAEAIRLIDPIFRGSFESYRRVHRVLYSDPAVTPLLLDAAAENRELTDAEVEGYQNLVDKVRVDREYAEITLRAIVDAELSTSSEFSRKLSELADGQRSSFWEMIRDFDHPDDAPRT